MAGAGSEERPSGSRDFRTHRLGSADTEKTTRRGVAPVTSRALAAGPVPSLLVVHGPCGAVGGGHCRFGAATWWLPGQVSSFWPVN